MGSIQVRSVQRCFFFFQAEDGIRDDLVTGVQTCALPIWPSEDWAQQPLLALCRAPGERGLVQKRSSRGRGYVNQKARTPVRNGVVAKIGRASCRERV